MTEQAVTVWNLINTGGVVALMFINLWLLLRGDILPRRVYEELTTRILKDLCREVIEGVRDMIREERAKKEDK